MAEEDLSLTDPEQEAESGGKKKLIIIIAAVVLLVAGAAAYFLLFAGSDEEQGQAVAESADGEAVSADGEAGDTVKGEVVYITMPDPFRLNNLAGKKNRIMEVRVVMVVSSTDAQDAVEKHLPSLRDHLLDYFSAADPKVVLTQEGRSEFKQGALLVSQEAMKLLVGFEAIDDLLFTGFVVQ
jgi:flagellar protein FliL